MKKKILAVVLAIIIVLLAIVLCIIKANDKNDDFYYVDENGVVQNVEQDEDGNYFITDEDGNVSYVDKENVIEQTEINKDTNKDKETNKDTNKDNNSKDDKDDILSEINTDPDKVFDDANKNNGLNMSDDIIKEEVVTVPTESGKADATKRLNTYKKIIGTNKFTIQATVKEIGSESTEYPFTYIRSGNGAYIETAVPFDEGKVIKANMIIKDGVTYCEIPSLKSYMVVDDMGIEDLASGTFSGTEIERYVFSKSGTVKVNGNKYTCDVFMVDNETVKYYYNSKGTLVRIETVSKHESVITEIKAIKNSADDSKIKKPKGINLTAVADL